MNTLIRKTLLVAGAGILTLSFAASVGAVTAGVNVSASTGSATSVSASAKASAQVNMVKMITAADKAITNRITALTSLNTRINAMQKVSADQKAAFSNNLQTEIANLTTLKSKIDADTDATTLKADIQSVTKSYRIYALVLPQGVISAAADRILTITDAMTIIGTKIQTRISAAPAGTNTVAITAMLADFNAKILSATTQANASVSEVASLMPDDGNTAIAASNKAALEDAKAKLKTAATDLIAARKDAGTMVATLKTISPQAASASASASTNANASAGQ